MLKIITYVVILANVIIALVLVTKPAAPSQDQVIASVPKEKQLTLLVERYPPAVEVVEESSSSENETNEIGQLAIPEIDLVSANPNPEQVEESENNLCYDVGPFENGKEANKIGKILQDEDILVNRYTKTEKQVYGYQVYIPPKSDRLEAELEVLELRDRGVLDYYIMKDGEFEHAISLGLFKLKAGALRRTEEVRKLDFPVKMQARDQDVEIYWLNVVDESGKFSVDVLKDLKQENAQLQRFEKKCQ